MDYLVLDRARVNGNLIKESKVISGIFKVRNGKTTGGNYEAFSSNATAHVHPQDFDDIQSLVGNGIRYNGVDYEIEGAVEGKNFNTNEVEFYRLTLIRLETELETEDNVIDEEFV